MKSLHQSNSEVSFRRPTKFKTVLDKQNLPNNLPKHPSDAGQIITRKVGLEIRNRIQKGYNNNLEKQPLCQSAILNLPSLSLRESESLSSMGQIKGKNVSFDQSDRHPSALRRHDSRKSILKNSLSNSKRSSSLQRSQISLANSHVDYQDQSVDFSVGNRALMQKYKALKNNCVLKGEKYQDQIYPPVKSSIYLNNSLMKNFCEMFQKEGRSIQWMRLSQLFKNEKLIVWSSENNQKSHITKGYISKTSGDSDFLTTVFNCITEKNNLLEKMFESQEVNNQGIYYVKIHQTQTNIWKYVIIDDYIPVIVNTKLQAKERYLAKNVHPAFLNVYALSNKLQIWPFLLQKALAKYYSTYDSLANGNTLDFLEQIASVFLQNVKIKDNLDKVRHILQNSDTLMLGQDKNGILHPFKTMNLESEIKTFIYLDRDDNFIEKALQRQEFLNKFNVLHYSQLHKYYYTNKCQIQQQNLRNRVNSQKQPYILREFIVQQNCQCQIGTIQKQQRFYRSYLTYQYVWMRLILVEKENKGYRWIGGAYSNNKSTKLTAVLTPGEYVVIMIPEWRQKAYDFSLIFHGNVHTLFQRKKYQLYPDIIQQACMDLAQRFGKMIQVNKNICSYHFIDKNIGFIIENINNQKQSGHVRILRSVQGLQNYNIRPINPEFANKANVEITIPKRGHFTVVMMTSKGVERTFLDSFDFGF